MPSIQTKLTFKCYAIIFEHIHPCSVQLFEHSQYLQLQTVAFSIDHSRFKSIFTLTNTNSMFCKKLAKTAKRFN